MNNYFNGIPPYYNSYPNVVTPLYGMKPSFSLSRIANKLNINNILNGASKTLGVINQAIPVFYQIKPLWNNAKTMLRVAKIIKSDDKPKQETNNTNNNNGTNPSFFI